jgi:hypothetical protein
MAQPSGPACKVNCSDTLVARAACQTAFPWFASFAWEPLTRSSVPRPRSGASARAVPSRSLGPREKYGGYSSPVPYVALPASLDGNRAPLPRWQVVPVPFAPRLGNAPAPRPLDARLLDARRKPRGSAFPGRSWSEEPHGDVASRRKLPSGRRGLLASDTSPPEQKSKSTPADSTQPGCWVARSSLRSGPYRTKSCAVPSAFSRSS